MELKDFISETLSQIVEGVSNAAKSAEQHGAKINPHVITQHEALSKQGMLWSPEGHVQIVKFDVALTVTEGTGTKGGIGVFIGAVTLGGSGESQASSTSVSRVQFNVPVALPKK